MQKRCRLARKVKIFLCRKHTTASLVVIGDQFGIGDSAVAQSYSRFLNEMKTDRRLSRQVDKIEKMIKMGNVETYPRKNDINAERPATLR